MAFAGQVTWITGASSGIGAALSRALAAQGAHLILSGRNEAALGEVAEQCGSALVLPFEATDYAAAARAADQAWGWKGRVDMLVNNAGISQRSLAVDTAFPVYERIVAVDLLAPIALTQALLPRMAERKSGRIVMVSSIAGKVGSPLRTGYSAAKFGLFGYSDALRAEVAGLGIKVHVIAPGSIRTDVSRNAITADGSRRGVSDAVIERGLDPDVAAGMMLDAIAADEREIIMGEGMEKEIGELRRTPDALHDRMAAVVAAGYAQKMDEGAPE
ncbi:SDR family NAD(P)-dependent oxidoreductase [Novosphingobium subterraneum]|uniref:Short-chain dehydrogenase/reductase SDR n=1 Tax=Novosphingobium subterraneum TaxID=48936 RepID=A0A0B9ADF6_9SPHN|nr:SDR family NAD(P)-dependent oxidoreductase [Novosphingobium subterraneum]KHS48645.1 short-chain dehydrogenase/reductase SDR [Novosphingobium subterraneum]